MRLIFKVSLSLLAVFLLFVVVWLTLPGLLARLAENQLEKYGFSNVTLSISQLNLQTTTVDRLQMSGSSAQINVEGLQLRYSLSRLLSGQLNSIIVKDINVNRLAEQGETEALPDPAFLARVLVIPWQRYNPADTVSFEKLTLFDANGERTLSATIDLARQADSIRAQARLIDQAGKRHRLNFTLSPTKGIDLQWRSPESESKNPVSVRIYPQQQGSGLAGQVSIDFSALTGLVAELDGLSGRMQATISYLERLDDSGKDINIQAEIVDAGLAESSVHSIHIDVAAVVSQAGNGFSLDIAPVSVIKMDGLQRANNRIDKLRIKLPRRLDIVHYRPLLKAGNGAEVEFRNIKIDNIHVPQARLDEFILNVGQGPGVQNNCSYKMKLQAPQLLMDGLMVTSDAYQIQGQCPGKQTAQWTMALNNSRLTIENDDLLLSLSDCRISAMSSADGDLTDISGHTICQSKQQNSQLSTRFVMNSEVDSGSVDYTFNEISPQPDMPLFGSLMKEWQQPYDIVSGSLSVTGNYSWWIDRQGKDSEKLSMRLSLKDAGGFYDEVSFNGLNYVDQIELLPTISSSKFSPLSVSNIDVGVPITAGRLQLMLSESAEGPLPKLKINGLSLSLLGGQIMGNDLEIDTNVDVHDLVLVINGLDVAQIVALQQLDGLFASGRLDGYIPVTLTKEGIKIKKGKIVAQQQGGTIKYRPAGGTAEMEKAALGSELVFRIVENLEYDSLKINLDYDDDGEMEMQFSIEGISPKVDQNRPVHFNLNIQQNVLKLLHGLRYAEGLSEQIDKNLQKNLTK